MTQHAMDRPLYFDGPPMRPTAPPAGVLRFRVGVWCGAPDHPRVILEAQTLKQLDAAEQRWRCPVCGRPGVCG